MAWREFLVQEAEQLDQLIAEIIGQWRVESLTPQREGFEWRAAGRPTHAEIDAPWIERVKHAERLGDFERTVVRQHDAARPHANAHGLRADARDQNLRRRA